MMKRREFITLLGGAAAWPLVARAQQPTKPVVAVLSNGALVENEDRQIEAFRRALEESGYVDGHTVAVEYYLADAQRMPSIIAVLISRNVSLIVPIGNAVALLAKAATKSIPIVFSIGGNPVDLGLVASLARPGGNVTGFTNLNNELEAKRLEILSELVPSATTIAVVLDSSLVPAEGKLAELEPAARRLGRQLRVFKAGNEAELERTFSIVADERIGALQITTSNFFASQRRNLAGWASRYAVPSIFGFRDFAASGGLASYGPNITDAWRRAGIYAGRILKGEKPADLPAIQSAQFELVLNLKMAKTLALTVPLSVRALATEVIE
jgi:putative ABC transport system substrate-binding protein